MAVHDHAKAIRIDRDREGFFAGSAPLAFRAVDLFGMAGTLRRELDPAFGEQFGEGLFGQNGDPVVGVGRRGPGGGARGSIPDRWASVRHQFRHVASQSAFRPALPGWLFQ